MNDVISDFSEKYDTYSGIIYGIAMTYTGSKSDSEDVMQEVFMKLLYSSPGFDSEDHEKHWVIRATVNVCKNLLKSFSRKKSVSFEDASSCLTVPFEADHAQLLLSLKPEIRMMICLKYVYGYKIEEIAEMLGISESAVKMRLKRGREKLQLEMNEGE